MPPLNGRPLAGSERGFTLIEVIVSLILVGILASIGGMAIVQAVQGYMTTRDNATMTQKSQLAMSRITREIIEMINIPSNATSSALPINNIAGNRTIGLDSGALKIAFDPATLSGGDILLDNVSAFALTYWTRNPSTGAATSSTTWAAASDITTLSNIDINLQISRTGGGVITFTNRVTPRNNKNQGGAAPATAPPSAPSYGIGCFVATAAYGDPAHPMVQILRDFRDQYLVTWKGGQWLAEQYYRHGPALADLIRNRPIAMWAARALLAPIVAMAFFLIYAPLALPVLILLSLILAAGLCSAVRRGTIPLKPAVFRNRGSVLLALIGTMVVMAVLSAAMLPIFSASYMNQVYADQGRKTYYLAESGFRYAASQFLNANTPALKDAAMTAMNNKTCNLLNNAGSFTTRVYPYWFKAQAASGANALTVDVSGTVPAVFASNSGGQIRVGGTYYDYTSRSSTGTTITFGGLSPLATVTAGSDVQPTAQTTATSISKSSDLALSGGGYATFPVLNGNFILYPAPTGIPGGAVFNYTKRDANILRNVTLVNGTQNAAWTSASAMSASTTNVVLDRFLSLSSTGTLGNSSREVVYNIPVGWMAGGTGWGKAQYIERFNDDSNWFTAQGLGTHTTSGGAMRATSTVNPTGGTVGGLGAFLGGLLGWGGNGFWGFNAFNWGNTDANLAQAWMDSEGCLSYDLQVKVANTGPYFMAGLGFRMVNNSNSSDLYQYGVSFIRARQTRTRACLSPPDFICGGWSGFDQNSDMASALIPPGLYPASPETGSTYACGWPMGCQDQYSNPAIILWQRTGPAATTGNFKLLAYRVLDAGSGVLTGSSPNFRLKDWSSLMVRLIEGYELPFTLGLVDAGGRHLKYGDTIKNSAGTKTARIIGTPVMTTNWGAATTTTGAGTLTLTNVTGSGFVNGEALYLEGGGASSYAQASAAQAATKANYIMVYYSDDKTAVAGNTVQTDGTRIGNTRDGEPFLTGKAWPPDDYTDRTAGLPTATPPGNDYYTLVQWQQLVAGSGLSLSVTPANGWTYSGGNLSRVAALGAQMAPALTSGNWTVGSGWSVTSSQLRKNANGTGTARPNPALAITAGTTYDVSITVTNRTAGSFSYTIGGYTSPTYNANGTYPITFTATGTGNLIFTPTNTSRFRITAVSVRPHTTAADQPVSHAALTVGTTYNAAVNVSSLTSGSFYYTIGGCTSGTCSSTGSCNLSCTASNTNPLTFHSPTADNRFTISSISVGSADTYVGTLDTSGDGYGNAASFVNALSSSDFYQAIIKTGALHSTAWTSSSTTSDFSGNAIALSTSGCTPSTANCFAGQGNYTFYDDFGIQLDTKSGTGFLPPIQQ